MKYCVFLLLAAALCAQESATYVWDIDGNRQLSSQSRQVKTRDGKQTVDGVPSMNGSAPIEQVDERVLEQTASSKVIERVVTYPSGERAKLRIEENKRPDGSSSLSTTLYQGDTNGEFQLAERSVRHSSHGVSETLIERPTLNGALELVEKQAGTERKLGAATEQTVVTYRRDASGSFNEAVREVSLRAVKNGVTEETTDQFLEGQMNGRTVTLTRKAADGGEVREISLYGMSAPGRAATDQPQLREQRRIERHPTGTNTTVETLSIRRPALDDTRNLGAYERVSERVCTGCKP